VESIFASAMITYAYSLFRLTELQNPQTPTMLLPVTKIDNHDTENVERKVHRSQFFTFPPEVCQCITEREIRCRNAENESVKLKNIILLMSMNEDRQLSL